MISRVLNRDFEHPSDGFYQIEAKGYHPTQNGGKKIVQVIDDKAIQSISNQFNQDTKNEALRHGKEMLIDREHFKHDQDKDTTAYGWMCQAVDRPDGLYAQIRWTGTGQSAVDGGDYRFFSTEYDPSDFEPVSSDEIPESVRAEYSGYTFVRPLRLDGLSLTNMNNNLGQKPITNRHSARLQDTPVGPTQQEAELVMKRAKALKQQFPNIALASLVIMASKIETTPVINRAVALREAMPTLSLASSIIMAQRGGGASVIMNRAMSLQKQTPTLSLATAVNIAHRERPNMIMNRALELRGQVQNLSLATAVIMAQREFSADTKLLNRPVPQPSDADWKSANEQADTVLEYIEDASEKPTDVGYSRWFNNAPSHLKFSSFVNAIRNAVCNHMTISDAFQKIKETQPVFWTQSILNFPKFKEYFEGHYEG